MANEFKRLKYALKEVKDSILRYTWGFRHVRSFYYKLKCLCIRHDLIRTKLEKTSYHDKPELILHGLMNLVVEFVEDERGFDLVDFNNGGSWSAAGVTIMEVYGWWKDYPDRVKEVDTSLDNWYNHTTHNRDILVAVTKTRQGTTKQTKRYFNIHTYLEEKLRKEENEMLAKTITIREFLWT
jgi:hypothetical protein